MIVSDPLTLFLGPYTHHVFYVLGVAALPRISPVSPALHTDKVVIVDLLFSSKTDGVFLTVMLLNHFLPVCLCVLAGGSWKAAGICGGFCINHTDTAQHLIMHEKPKYGLLLNKDYLLSLWILDQVEQCGVTLLFVLNILEKGGLKNV